MGALARAGVPPDPEALDSWGRVAQCAWGKVRKGANAPSGRGEFEGGVRTPPAWVEGIAVAGSVPGRALAARHNHGSRRCRRFLNCFAAWCGAYEAARCRRIAPRAVVSGKR